MAVNEYENVIFYCHSFINRQIHFQDYPIQIPNCLMRMTFPFLFTLYCHNLLSVFAQPNISECSICVYTCDTYAIHLGDRVLTSCFPSPQPLRNGFLVTVATAYIATAWRMCLCHDAGRYRHTLQKTGHISLAESMRTTQCRQQTATECKLIINHYASLSYTSFNFTVLKNFEEDCRFICTCNLCHLSLSLILPLLLTLPVSLCRDWQLLLRLDPCTSQSLSLCH